MRARTLFLCLLFVLPIIAQAPSYTAKPYGNLKQIMRDLSLHNSNIIFSAQVIPPKDELAWQSVANAAMAIQETAKAIMLPGRFRSNGQPVPVEAGDYTKYAAALARAGKDCLKAARFKSQDGLSGCTDNLSQACDNCHNVYRDRRPRR